MSNRADIAPELNLSAHRAPASVWDRRGWNGTAETPPITRVLLGIGGSMLALQGVRRRGVTGSIMTGIGWNLAWWAITGRSSFPRLQRWAVATARAPFGEPHDLVHEASKESFPASDAPSWTPAVGTGLRREPGAH